MKTFFVNRNIIVSIFVVMLLIYGVPGISYGQGDAPTVTPGETNTSLVVRFQITLDEGVDENAYEVQLRQKSPQGAWISRCVVIERGNRSEIAGDPDVSASAVYIDSYYVLWIRHGGYYSDKTFRIKAIFTDLDRGTTYEARYRDANLSVCSENPPSPDPWSEVGEGTTHLVAPPRAEFVDTNLASGVRNALKLETEGGHIELLKIPQASLVKLTKLNLEDAGIADLTGLGQATQLTELYLTKNQISDITPLAQCTRLTELYLSENQITNISSLIGLTSLESLSLLNNPITDTSVLQGILRANPELYIFFNRQYIVTQPARGTDLYWMENDFIRRANLVETHFQDLKDHVQVLNSVGYRSADQIALDLVNGKMYWSDTHNDCIQCANLDGSDARKLFTNIRYPKGIAIDSMGGKIYWASGDSWRWRGGIFRANLDGSDIQKLITVSDGATGIALDTARGKMYWHNDDEENIQRANLDGTNIQNVVPIYNPYHIAIDIARGKVYWTTYSKIQRANLDGTNVQDVVTGVRPQSIAIDTVAGKMYWTTRDKIQRANLDGTNIQDVATELSYPYGLALNPSFVRFFPHTSVTFSPVQPLVVGEQLEVSLNITGGEAVAGYHATVQFDDTALRYVSSANGDFLPADAFFAEPTVKGNLIQLNAASLAGESNGDGTLATLTFEVLAANTSALKLSDVLLSNSAGEIFVPKVENATTEPIQLKGDVNGDGTVSITDLVLVASNFDKTGENDADVNGDSTVDIADLVLVAGALGNSAAAPSLYPQVLEILTAADVKLWLSTAQQLDLTDTTSQRGIMFLQQLLATLTPKETALLANYPNPFNPETWIPYHLAKDAEVTLHIYAMNGTLVRTLTLGHQAAGMYQNRTRAAYWDGKNEFGEPVASGVYFYTFKAGDFTATRKMLIRK